MRRIYHIVPRTDWDQAPAGPYRAASLETEGFIHCSNADQVAWVANQFYAGTADLLVLEIDVGRLASPVREEDVGGGRYFPHVHGPVAREAVGGVHTLRRGPDGRWVFPESEPDA